MPLKTSLPHEKRTVQKVHSGFEGTFDIVRKRIFKEAAVSATIRLSEILGIITFDLIKASVRKLLLLTGRCIKFPFLLDNYWVFPSVLYSNFFKILLKLNCNFAFFSKQNIGLGRWTIILGPSVAF